MFRYETHLHTSPASKCSRSSVRESLEFYKSLGYDGVFITNHFLDGNCGADRSASYEERIHFYFADYEEGLRLADEIGIRVFCGIESSMKGTDFLIYGLDKQWYLDHPEILTLYGKEKIQTFMDAGALVIQAHPYREDYYIDHIRLFPRQVHGVEICNSSRPAFENEMAKRYCDHYDMIAFAGSDNHTGPKRDYLAGMESETPIVDEADFVARVKSGDIKPFELHR